MQVRNLKAYLANIDMTMKQFARKIKCNPGYLNGVVRGDYTPSYRLAKDIYEETGGVIWLECKEDRPEFKCETDIKELQKIEF